MPTWAREASRPSWPACHRVSTRRFYSYFAINLMRAGTLYESHCKVSVCLYSACVFNSTHSLTVFALLSQFLAVNVCTSERTIGSRHLSTGCSESSLLTCSEYKSDNGCVAIIFKPYTYGCVCVHLQKYALPLRSGGKQRKHALQLLGNQSQSPSWLLSSGTASLAAASLE